MFKKSNKHSQIDLFGGVPSILDGKSLNQYTDDHFWHNQFRKQVTSHIDESIFKVLFNEKIGAPNASVSLLIGMMILKEAFGWSDSQLFEQCRFNLLVRSALGLFNLNDDIPTESTYYLFRKRIYDHRYQNNDDLLQKTFDLVTGKQVKEFNVDGRSIRMDSKLIGSNIALFSRYEIIHHTLTLFYKSLNNKELLLIGGNERQLLQDLSIEEPLKTIYRSTKEEVKSRMQSLGILLYKVLSAFSGRSGEQYLLLQRVFKEQYSITEEKEVLLRPNEEIASDSTQSPHDPDSAYRHKADQKVKGYSVNVTETVSEGPLDLITSVLVDKANVSDTKFVEPAIQATANLTGTPVEKVYADGAYQSPDNDQFCEKIDMVYTGIKGFLPRHDLEMTQDGLIVTDMQTGESIKATLAKKLKNAKEDVWFIDSPEGRVYFRQQAIRTSLLRRVMKGRSVEELKKRNNVEATVFQLSYPLRNNKTRYRSLIKHQVWAICRCMWINLVRIKNFLIQTCQRTTCGLKNTAFSWSYNLNYNPEAFNSLKNWLHLSYLAITLIFIKF